MIKRKVRSGQKEKDLKPKMGYIMRRSRAEVIKRLEDEVNQSRPVNRQVLSGYYIIKSNRFLNIPE
jgi:hypothetical protein